MRKSYRPLVLMIVGIYFGVLILTILWFFLWNSIIVVKDEWVTTITEKCKAPYYAF